MIAGQTISTRGFNNWGQGVLIAAQGKSHQCTTHQILPIVSVLNVIELCTECLNYSLQLYVWPCVVPKMSTLCHNYTCHAVRTRIKLQVYQFTLKKELWGLVTVWSLIVAFKGSGSKSMSANKLNLNWKMTYPLHSLAKWPNLLQEKQRSLGVALPRPRYPTRPSPPRLWWAQSTVILYPSIFLPSISRRASSAENNKIVKQFLDEWFKARDEERCELWLKWDT